MKREFAVAYMKGCWDGFTDYFKSIDEEKKCKQIRKHANSALRK